MPVTRITVQNRTGRPLVPYLMVETRVGRRRMGQPALTVPAGGSYELDPLGDNPVFFDSQGGHPPLRASHRHGQDPSGSRTDLALSTRPGVLVELPLPNGPRVLASTVYLYCVPPDLVDNDPSHAPRQLRRSQCQLAPSTTSVTISLGTDFVISFDEHSGLVASSH